MTILTYGLNVITLPDDLLWQDEFAWQPVQQATQYSLTGALIIESAAKQAGRTITLQGGDEFGWLPRSTLLALQTAATLPGQEFTLTLRGSPYTVVFDHARTPIEAAPAVDYSTPDAADPYIVTLRFLEV